MKFGTAIAITVVLLFFAVPAHGPSGAEIFA
jgi:hypothetical protein